MLARWTNFQISGAKLRVIVILGLLARIPTGRAEEDRLAELHRHSTELFEQKKLAEAEVVAQEAVSLAEQQSGAEALDVATPLMHLALLYRVQGKHRDAEPLNRRAVAIVERSLGPRNPRLAQALDGLARVSLGLSKNAEAEVLFERSLAIREKHLGPDDPLVAESLRGLAASRLSRKQYAEAEALLERCLSIQKRIAGPESAVVAEILDELATAQGNQANDFAFDDPNSPHHRASIIWDRVRDAPPLAAVSRLETLARQFQPESGDAEEALQHTVAIREKALGADHPECSGRFDRPCRALPAVRRLGKIYLGPRRSGQSRASAQESPRHSGRCGRRGRFLPGVDPMAAIPSEQLSRQSLGSRTLPPEARENSGTAPGLERFFGSPHEFGARLLEAEQVR